MPAMKYRYLVVLLVLWNPDASAADTDTNPIPLAEAREQGRLKSRFLQGSQPAISDHATPQADLQPFEKSLGSILTKSCLACHGPEVTEGRLRVDELDPNLLTGENVDQWREIYNVLSNSEMPPEDDTGNPLTETDRGKLVDWLSRELNKASLVRRNSKEHSSFRRLTKYEYNYALQDLLGLPFDLAKQLPPETASEDGFKNSSELLQMSAMQFETYRDIALQALKRATVSGERPDPVTYIISMQEEMQKATGGKNDKTFLASDDDYQKQVNRQHFFDRQSGTGFHFSNGKATPRPDAVIGQDPALSPVVMVLPRSKELKMNLDRFLPDEGTMRVSIRAGRSSMATDEHAALRLIFSAHTSNNASFSQVISERDVPVTASADAPEFIHFDIPLGDIQRNPFRKLATTFPRRDEFLHIRNESNAHNRENPLHVLIDYVEISAPFYQQWPPKTHTAIFFESENQNDETVYGREILSRFLRRVWRRSVTTTEVDQFMNLFAEYRPSFPSLETAMLEVLATALASPEFLYLTQRVNPETANATNEISDFEFASRLAIFLWSSIPDEELLKLADQGKLQEPAVLNAQIERMLADPRSRRFSSNFVQQWLGLDGMQNATHVKDDALRAAMQEEPVAFFEEVLGRNHSVMDFLHSDYVVVNERLASHYRMPPVRGPHFRKVSIDPKTPRGGLLTSAAVLAMNSDGTDSHPLKRGVWMLERILHDPPPPPPPNVPEVDLTDPEILKMTLKERIADHRNKPACISCHARIDPWGVAFENYDALGSYRTSINKKPVDATSELFNKHTLTGMEGLKRYLLTDRQDQFSRAMVHKMTAYALGRPLSFGDRADVDNLTTLWRADGDRLGDLVHLIINSELFGSR
ncbi:MAG: DUF1592 domain-containing protein [Rubripirellula sp.]|nr:DUF1592 domain-containing protein [Rubripirellula sp.]